MCRVCSVKHLLQMECSNCKRSCIIKHLDFSSCFMWAVTQTLHSGDPHLPNSANDLMQTGKQPLHNGLGLSNSLCFLPKLTSSKQLRSELGPHRRWLPEVGRRFCADRHCLVLLIVSIQDLFHFRGL